MSVTFKWLHKHTHIAGRWKGKGERERERKEERMIKANVDRYLGCWDICAKSISEEKVFIQ